MGALGVDQAFNGGKGTTSLFNSVKGYFNPQRPAPTPDTTSTWSAPDSTGHVFNTAPHRPADVMADVSAGYVGNHRNTNHTEIWKEWLNNRATAAGAGVFQGVPGQLNLPSTPNGAMTETPMPTGLLDKTIGAVDSLTSTPSLGYGALDLAGKLGKGESSYPLSKAVGNISRSITGHPIVSTAAKALGPAWGATSGYSLGSNPLVIESMHDTGNGQSWADTARDAKASGTILGGVTGLSGLGPVVPTAADMVLNRGVDSLGHQAASVQERGDLGDLLLRHMQMARTGNPHYQQALKDTLGWIDRNPGLTKDINQGATGGLDRFLSLGGQERGSPVIAHLIQKAREQAGK